MRPPPRASASPPGMNDAGPSLVPEEDETPAKRQRIAGSMNDAGPYPAPKEDSEISAKSQRIAARHE